MRSVMFLCRLYDQRPSSVCQWLWASNHDGYRQRRPSASTVPKQTHQLLVFFSLFDISLYTTINALMTALKLTNLTVIVSDSGVTVVKSHISTVLLIEREHLSSKLAETFAGCATLLRFIKIHENTVPERARLKRRRRQLGRR